MKKRLFGRARPGKGEGYLELPLLELRYRKTSKDGPIFGELAIVRSAKAMIAGFWPRRRDGEPKRRIEFNILRAGRIAHEEKRAIDQILRSRQEISRREDRRSYLLRE
jgi:hypothetical protein